MWNIETTDLFDSWFESLDDTDRGSVLAAMLALNARGPMLPRPYADTIKGSKYANMQELRVQSKGDPIRAFFVFDPRRHGIVLCAGHKAGNEKPFYQIMIPLADEEYRKHLQKLQQE
ncbi:MAG: diaminopimelate decarboxylase [Alishewanella sp. 32-51-5]|nr:MAG: diaminopimelate decarboxylase [Alishewanella sp. 32-51-5]